jgi:hypothetical protein
MLWQLAEPHANPGAISGGRSRDPRTLRAARNGWAADNDWAAYPDARSLQRRLAASGASYQDMVETTRREAAEKYL